MSIDNQPFRAPFEEIYGDTETTPGDFLPEGRLVSASSGYQWLWRGWEMFRVAPGVWIGIAVVFMLVVLTVRTIPLVGVAVNLLIPVFIGGISIGCRAIEDGQEIRFGHLFAGFLRQPGRLLLVGLLYLLVLVVAAVAVALVATVTGVAALATVGREGPDALDAWIVVVSFLAMILVFAPLAMAVWLAPPLVLFHEFSAYQAIRASLFVALRNFPPFLVYVLLILVASVLASLPLLLGWLVLLPVLYASLYAAYRDLFFAA